VIGDAASGRWQASHAAADDLNRRDITTVSGKRWQAVLVIRARNRPGLVKAVLAA